MSYGGTGGGANRRGGSNYSQSTVQGSGYVRSLGGNIGVWGGDYDPAVDTQDYIKIGVASNARDFNELYVSRQSAAATTNGYRGVVGGGYGVVEPAGDTLQDSIDFYTFSSFANGADFGNLTVAKDGAAATSNGSKGIFGGGHSTAYGEGYEYVTISTLGNAVSFGQLWQWRAGLSGASDGERSVWSAGTTPPANENTNVIEYVGMTTLGDASDFGDLSFLNNRAGMTSDYNRGVTCAGHNESAYVDSIDFYTIPTIGNAADFGNLTQARGYTQSLSDGSRGITGSGSGPVDTMDFITIGSTGHAVDFAEREADLMIHGTSGD